MAKKKKISPEEEAFQKLLKKAQGDLAATLEKEKSKRVVESGKELVMFLCWLVQMGVADAPGEEKVKLWAAQAMQDYPKELKEVLAYYDRLKEYDTRKNFLGFVCRGKGSFEEGCLWLRIQWKHLDLPDESGRKEEGQE